MVTLLHSIACIYVNSGCVGKVINGLTGVWLLLRMLPKQKGVVWSTRTVENVAKRGEPLHRESRLGTIRPESDGSDFHGRLARNSEWRTTSRHNGSIAASKFIVRYLIDHLLELPAAVLMATLLMPFTQTCTMAHTDRVGTLYWNLSSFPSILYQRKLTTTVWPVSQKPAAVPFENFLHGSYDLAILPFGKAWAHSGLLVVAGPKNSWNQYQFGAMTKPFRIVYTMPEYNFVSRGRWNFRQKDWRYCRFWDMLTSRGTKWERRSQLGLLLSLILSFFSI